MPIRSLVLTLLIAILTEGCVSQVKSSDAEGAPGREVAAQRKDLVPSAGAGSGEPIQALLEDYKRNGRKNYEVEEILNVLGVRQGQLMSNEQYAATRRKDMCLKALSFVNPWVVHVPFTRERQGAPDMAAEGTIEPITAKILRNAISNQKSIQDSMVEEAKREVDGPAFDTYQPPAGKVLTLLSFEPALYGQDAWGSIGHRLIDQMKAIEAIVNEEYARAAKLTPALGTTPVFFMVPLDGGSAKGSADIKIALFTRHGRVEEIKLDEDSEKIDQAAANRILSLINPSLSLAAAKALYFPGRNAAQIDDRIFTEPTLEDSRMRVMVSATIKLPNGGRKQVLYRVSLERSGARMILKYGARGERNDQVCDVTRISDRLSGSSTHRSGAATYECKNGVKLIRRFHDEGGDSLELSVAPE